MGLPLDQTNIRRAGVPQELYNRADGWENTGNAVETTVLSLVGVVPANALGNNGRLKITTLWSCTVSDASVKTGRVKINGTLVDTAVLTSTRQHQKDLILRNRNSRTAQVATGPTVVNSYGQSSAAVVYHAIDTAAPLDVTFTIQNSLAADSTKLEGVIIEIVPAA